MSFLAQHPRANSTAMGTIPEVDLLGLGNAGSSFLSSTRMPITPKTSIEIREMVSLVEENEKSLTVAMPTVAPTSNVRLDDDQTPNKSKPKIPKRRSIGDLLERYREVKNRSKHDVPKINYEEVED